MSFFISTSPEVGFATCSAHEAPEVRKRSSQRTERVCASPDRNSTGSAGCHTYDPGGGRDYPVDRQDRDKCMADWCPPLLPRADLASLEFDEGPPVVGGLAARGRA